MFATTTIASHCAPRLGCVLSFVFTRAACRSSSVAHWGACLIAAVTLTLCGCSSAEPEPEAAPVSAAPMPTMQMDKADDEGGETYGGGSYGDDANGSAFGQDDEELSPMDMMQRMAQSSGGSGASPMMSMPMMGGEDGMGMGSAAMPYGMPGMGGNVAPQFNAAMQFVRTNCSKCHAAQQTQGNVRLDGLSDQFSDNRIATLWHAVQQQLESQQMPPSTEIIRPDAKQQEQLLTWIKTSLLKVDFVPLQERDYLSQAEHAFSSGNEKRGVELLYAQAVAADEGFADELLSQARWFELGLHPTLTLRFAVGVDLDADDSIEDLKPLGSSLTGGGASMGMQANSSGGSAGKDDETKQRTFEQMTGDFGSALVTSFESRWMEGQFGTAFKDIEPQAPLLPSNNNSMGMMGSMGAMTGMPDGMDRGGYPGMMPGGAGSGANAAAKQTTEGTILTPGLVFIGTGKFADLLAKAAAAGADGLFLFDVKANMKRRGGVIENSTKLRFMSLAGKTQASTGLLVNTDIEKAKQRGKEEDTLDKNIERLFMVFDDKVKLASLPALKPEHAHDRMRVLIADAHVKPLTKLFEARLYHSLELLTDEELAKIYQIVLQGNEGLALAKGTIDDRRMVLSEVLEPE